MSDHACRSLLFFQQATLSKSEIEVFHSRNGKIFLMFFDAKTEIVGQQRHLHSEEVKINQRAWLPELGIEHPDIYKEIV